MSLENFELIQEILGRFNINVKKSEEESNLILLEHERIKFEIDEENAHCINLNYGTEHSIGDLLSNIQYINSLLEFHNYFLTLNIHLTHKYLTVFFSFNEDFRYLTDTVKSAENYLS